MRIAFLVPSLAQTGPIIVVEQLVKQFHDKHEVEVFYFDDIIEISLPCKTTKISFYKTYDFSRFDILHTHMLRCDIYYYMHRSKIKIPAVSTIHQYIQTSLQYSYNWLISIIFTKVWTLYLGKHKQLVCINKHMSELYAEKKINPNITYIYNGVKQVVYADVNDYDNELLLTLKKNYKLLLSISRLNKQKGIHQVLPFLVENKEYVYVVIGSGDELDALKKQAQDLGVEDRLHLLGFKSNATDYLKYADMFIMPSYAEGFGLALAEAASIYIPIVCSKIPAFSEMFTSEEVVFFELNNLSSLAQAIKSVDLESKTRTKLAFVKYNKLYTPEVMANQYLAIYHGL